MSMMADLLALARESLDDARLLAEHRRRNEGVLTRLALHQALQAVSRSEGLDADDGLRLDTLFRRVPADHPQAALIAALHPEAAQTIAAVAALVAALQQPVAKPVARPVPKPATMPKSKPPGPRPPPEAATEPEAEPETEPPRHRPTDLSGPTALDASPAGHGRSAMAASVPSAAFWTLMDRWGIGDLDALALIGHDGGLTKKGTRPRFRLQDDEAQRYASLRALDTALEAMQLDPQAWLATAQADGETPLAQLLRDRHGATKLVRALNRQGLQAALQQG